MLRVIDTRRKCYVTGNLAARLALFWGALLIAFPAHAERKAILHPGSTAHASPDDSSLTLGTYAQRTTVTLSDAAESGWYRVYFPHPVKGVSQGWIPESAIEAFVAAGQKTSQTRPRHKRKSWEDDDSDLNFKRRKIYLGVILDMTFCSPSSFQSQIGETTGGIGYFSYGLDFGYRFSDVFTGSSRFGYFSFSEKSSVTGIADAYDAKGFLFSVAGDFDVTSGEGRFETGPGFGVGLSFDTITNTNLSLQKSTSGIMQPYYFLRWVAGLSLGTGGVAFRAEVGYEFLTLNNVPVTPIANPTQNTLANLSLGGPYGGLGFYLQF